MNKRFAMAAMTALLMAACGGSPAQKDAPEAQPETAAQEQGLGKQCGTSVCGAEEFCCNESCGICAPKGGSCTQQVCLPGTLGAAPQEETAAAKPVEPSTEDSGGKKCGSNTCGAGEFCCNESCGICAPNGGFCTQQVCEPATLCGSNTCGTGEFCCNESCGICAPVGGGCIQTYCG